MDYDRLEENRRTVQRLFNELIYTGTPNFGVIDEIVDPGYIQHNPEAMQGPEGIRHFFTNVVPLPYPNWENVRKSMTVNYIAEGDFVVRQELRDRGMLIDIFRVQDGKLKEHWDAFRPNPGQPRPRHF